MASKKHSENTFGERLLTHRKSCGLSQSDLANLTGLQASAVSHFETGSRKPSIDNLLKISDALEVSVDYLLGRTNFTEIPDTSPNKIAKQFDSLSIDDKKFAQEFIANLAKRNNKARSWSKK